MVRAVLFDLDDTLVDHRHAHRAAVAGVRERFAALQRVATRRPRCRGHAPARSVPSRRSARYVGRRRRTCRALPRAVRLRGCSSTMRLRPPRRVLIARSYLGHRRRIAGALELLQALSAHVRIAVVTNNTLAEQSEKLATFELAPYVAALRDLGGDRRQQAGPADLRRCARASRLRARRRRDDRRLARRRRRGRACSRHRCHLVRSFRRVSAEKPRGAGPDLLRARCRRGPAHPRGPGCLDTGSLGSRARAERRPFDRRDVDDPLRCRGTAAIPPRRRALSSSRPRLTRSSRRAVSRVAGMSFASA